MTNLLEDKINELILDLLEKKQSMSLGCIVKDLEISAENGLRHLLQLKEMGIIENVHHAEFAISNQRV